MIFGKSIVLVLSGLKVNSFIDHHQAKYGHYSDFFGEFALCLFKQELVV